jgi:hypothetical protein
MRPDLEHGAFIATSRLLRRRQGVVLSADAVFNKPPLESGHIRAAALIFLSWPAVVARRRGRSMWCARRLSSWMAVG